MGSKLKDYLGIFQVKTQREDEAPASYEEYRIISGATNRFEALTQARFIAEGIKRDTRNCVDCGLAKLAELRYVSTNTPPLRASARSSEPVGS